MVLQAFVDDGDEILVPAPDYPLWTGAVTARRREGRALPLRRGAGWQPDLADIESKITDRTRGLVIINPNNPTGAVYSEQMVRDLVELARRHGLVVFSDEIYEKIVFDDAVHHHAATFAGDDVLCLTFSGLSKAYRVCGYRSGWVVISGPKHRADQLHRRAHAPRQHAHVPERARAARDPDRARRLPVHRRADRPRRAHLRAGEDRLALLNKIDGVSCVEPRGALYCFPKLDTELFGIDDDEKFVIDLLRATKILVSHGTGFNWIAPDHFRLVALPEIDQLTDAIERIAEYLDSRRRR